MPPRVPSEEDVLSWFDSLSNWGRWGPDDELGTLNLVSDAKRVEAAGLVRDGTAVSCAWDIQPPTRPGFVGPPPQRHTLFHLVSTHRCRLRPRAVAVGQDLEARLAVAVC